MRAKLSLAVASVLVSALAATAPAEAACKRFGFTVNDYGKEGPTNDAKNLLDKHISEWATQNGVTAYQTGKKSVSCELFLDVILFDEHTCTASANVCWGDGVKPNNKGAEQAEATDAGNGEIPPAPVSKAAALGIPAQQQTAAAPATDAAAAPAVDAAPTAPVEQIAAPAETPPATPAVQTATPATAPEAPAATATAVVETGALQAGQGLAAEKRVAPPAAPPQQDRAAAAAAAASAAAAAERAAQAAEIAANAAKEAAAAAVAASAASRGPASVPPLDHASGAKPAHTE
jgi:hypothetical protein